PGDRLQREGEITRRLEALIRVLFEAMTDDAIELGGQARIDLPKRRRIVPQNGSHRVDRRSSIESGPARRHLVENTSEGEDVRARVGAVCANLLGSHVSNRSQNDSLP